MVTGELGTFDKRSLLSLNFRGYEASIRKRYQTLESGSFDYLYDTHFSFPS